MTAFDEEYKQTVIARSDAFMKYVATIIAEEYAKEFEKVEEESKKTGVGVPPELDFKLRRLVSEFEKTERQRVRRQRFKTVAKVAAVVVLCFATIGTVLVATVDAVRTKAMDIFLVDHEEYSDIRVVESGYLPDDIKSQLPEAWKDVFYPMILAEGYHFAEADDLGSMKTLSFADGEENIISLSYKPTGEWQTMADSEDSETGEIEINGDRAVYFVKEERTMLFWSRDGLDFDLIVYLPLKQAIEIAENIKYVKLE
jgi:hypothetical protein